MAYPPGGETSAKGRGSPSCWRRQRPGWLAWAKNADVMSRTVESNRVKYESVCKAN